MTKRRNRSGKRPRGPQHSSRQSRDARPERDAISTEADYCSGIRGVGFAHMLHRAPSNMLDALLLEALDVPEGEPAPYTFEEPRHITSLPFITLDPEQLRYLRLGVDAQKFIEGIQDVCAEVTQGSKHVGQVIAAFQGGGKRLIAEIDSPAVHLGRKGLKQLFSNAGVGMPEMHAPHTTVAVADSFSDLRVMEAAMNDFIASETLEITFDPLDAYFENYTTLRRPTGHSS